MKLDKAIEILNHLKRGHYNDESANQTNALKLGIEALNRLQSARREGTLFWTTPLPGETED